MNRTLLSVLTILVLQRMDAPAQATVYFVTPDGTGDFPTIQDAVDQAVDGDTIELADGVFRGPGNRDIEPGSRAVTIRSRSGDAFACVIDCEHMPHRGFMLEQSVAILENFTIQNGIASAGGAVRVYSGAPVLRGLRLLDCYAAEDGGALWVRYGATISDCVLLGNRAGRHGGGACIVGVTADAALQRCTFEQNACTGRGGGVYIDRAHPSLADCIFLDNVAGTFGGGVCCQDECSPSFTRCTFGRNTATEFGGGLAALVAAPYLDECVFFDGSAGAGGGIGVISVAFWLFRSTLADNTAPLGANLWIGDGTAFVEKTILAFGRDGSAVHCAGEGSACNLACSDVYGSEGGDYAGCIAGQQGMNGNIEADPLFCDAEHGDYEIARDSPCAPGFGGQGCGRIGGLGVGCDLASIDVGADAGTRPPRIEAWPNPARAGEAVSIVVDGARCSAAAIILTVHDAQGRRVRTLAGSFPFVWDTRDNSGVPLPAGVYFCRLGGGGDAIAGRMDLFR